MERDQETITFRQNEQRNTAVGAMVAQPDTTHSPEIAERKRLEDELRESEWRFRTMFEQAAIGIAFTALDGHFLEVNQRLCDIVGYAREEMLERTFRDITHPDDLAVNEVYLQRLVADNHPTPSIEKRYIHKDGRVVWVHLTVSLMRDPLNQPHSYMSVVEDITVRKQVEEERARLLMLEQAVRAEAMQHASQLEAVIEAMADGVFIYDAEARLIEANKTAREIFALDLQPDYSSLPVRNRVARRRYVMSKVNSYLKSNGQCSVSFEAKCLKAQILSTSESGHWMDAMCSFPSVERRSEQPKGAS
jgi:PAS domain S-box-containing protein